MTANQVYKVNIKMGYTAYIFPRYHRIRVSVSSAAFPYYNPSSNTGEDNMVQEVTPVVAHNTVHFSANQYSRVTLTVVDPLDIPENPSFNGLGPFSADTTETFVI